MGAPFLNAKKDAVLHTVFRKKTKGPL